MIPLLTASLIGPSQTAKAYVVDTAVGGGDETVLVVILSGFDTPDATGLTREVCTINIFITLPTGYEAQYFMGTSFKGNSIWLIVTIVIEVEQAMLFEGS